MPKVKVREILRHQRKVEVVARTHALYPAQKVVDALLLGSLRRRRPVPVEACEVAQADGVDGHLGPFVELQARGVGLPDVVALSALGQDGEQVQQRLGVLEIGQGKRIFRIPDGVREEDGGGRDEDVQTGPASVIIQTCCSTNQAYQTLAKFLRGVASSSFITCRASAG
jgi:hypothetical protein